MDIEIEKYISSIDCSRFGIRVAKINEYEKSIEEYLIGFKAHDIDVVFARVSSDKVNIINEFEKNGFHLKDIQLTYQKIIKNTCIENHVFNDLIQIREAVLDDANSISEIAFKSFESYGHYYNDEKLDLIKVGEIYKDWALNSLTKDGVSDKVIIAEKSGEIAGFLSFKIICENGKKYAMGGLGAVSNKFRNLNIFKDINVAGLIWAKEMNLDWVEHNVLATNLPVNRVYNSLGFKLKDSFVTLHGWLNK